MRLARPGVPVTAVALALALLLGSYVWYTQRVVAQLRGEAQREGRMYARIYRAIGATDPDEANAALLDLSRHIRDAGVPVILTDTAGRPTAAANLPFEAPLSDPRVLAYVRALDDENPPVIEDGVGTVHFGHTPVVRGLRVIPALQAAVILLLVGAGAYGFRQRSRADRERVWAGMARESAHQLGTPLSSLSGWLELLHEVDPEDALTRQAVAAMQGDLVRLERVAHRFERIGRPPRREPVDVGELAERVAAYFHSRLPTLVHPVRIGVGRDDGPLVVQGDAVLLEWAVEALVKNAVDALAGRGGRMYLAASRADDGRVRLRVADDGPGIPRELRARIFEPGFTTKQSGWGIGLALARRIVEEFHGGRLQLVPSSRGATFDVILG